MFGLPSVGSSGSASTRIQIFLGLFVVGWFSFNLFWTFSQSDGQVVHPWNHDHGFSDEPVASHAPPPLPPVGKPLIKPLIKPAAEVASVSPIAEEGPFFVAPSEPPLPAAIPEALQPSPSPSSASPAKPTRSRRSRRSPPQTSPFAPLAPVFSPSEPPAPSFQAPPIQAAPPLSPIQAPPLPPVVHHAHPLVSESDSAILALDPPKISLPLPELVPLYRIPKVPEEPLGSESRCGHWNGRNYFQHPITSIARDERPDVLSNCDVPCVWQTSPSSKYIDIGRGSCDHAFSFSQTMEAAYSNHFHNSNPRSIIANCHLDSDVPSPYFSWVEYGFMEELKPKHEKAMAAAWISNCGAGNGRLNYLKRLMDAGVTVDSYGACLNNKANPRGKFDWFKSKIVALQGYKFAIAFENTFRTDYVTEKLFMSFIAGSVPIHMGVNDVHKFAPSNHSVISIHDFPNPEALAKYLLFLDSNPAEYRKYLDWKWKGYSPDFQAMVDLSNMHSTCRACIEAADRYRFMFGDPHSSVRPFPMDDPDFSPYGVDFWVKIRERNKFWFKRLWLPNDLTIEILNASVARLFKIQAPAMLYTIQTQSRPHYTIKTQSEVSKYVRPMTELEVIIIIRPDFSDLVEPDFL